VQRDFGGTDQAADPPAQVLQAATRFVRTVEPTLCARVDGVVDDGEFRLMELELIEPALFLSAHPEAAARFAEVITTVLTPRAT
jgi:hypothetical protein